MRYFFHSIIAFPGLHADPKKAFEPEGRDEGFRWLSDEKEGILSDIPGARVLRYDYDSRWQGKGAIKQTLYNAAENFLGAFVEHRKENEKRPFIILGHSLGGLVFAKALVLAASRPENLDRMRIVECFAGAIFFGTPFRGSAEAWKAFIFAKCAEIFNQKATKSLLNLLDPESDALAELRSDFVSLVAKEPAASIVCIYEEKDTTYFTPLRAVPKVARLMVCMVAKFQRGVRSPFANRKCQEIIRNCRDERVSSP
jgi:pimeloyl-ACP methyl ester carboxylesterase